MFKVRQGSIATDRDGVQDKLGNSILADYFLSAERNDREQKGFFKMKDSLMIQEMNLFCSMKGE